LGSYVTITNPIHPLYGQSLVILQIRKVGQETKVTVESPLGGFLSLRATETDLWTQLAKTTQRVEKFLPEKLLRLSEWVAERSLSFRKEFSCVSENKGVEHRKNNNETKASTTNRSTRKLRKAKSSNQANSTVSRQDTQKPKSRRGDRKE
jgi:primosomal protein N'